MIIFPEDRPKLNKKSYDQIDYVPDFILSQLFKLINNLHKEIIAVVWVMYKTKLRISDALGLKQNNNPEEYIFVRYTGRRKGKPYGQSWIQSTLNAFARKFNITNEMGNVYHFRNHAFRHTYAAKLLNGGADILIVQELLTHGSPEMTMRYTKLVMQINILINQTQLLFSVMKLEKNSWTLMSSLKKLTI